ncbi:hypothetical protein [Desmospora profundinema]|uniref:Uncharacterized protein n=1 Tax=Desmospora profundinema TaxID=1571184 RepID=A0ABU1INP5_9BACL|nr:hypothetical protein [Desmospora profundinema]MDR6225789.1 hypothetical protein [Desmospora profundinema]
MESSHQNDPVIPTETPCQPLRLREARQALEHTLVADAILFTLDEQWAQIDGIGDLPGLSSFRRNHERAATLHTAARGCLERMAGGDWHESIIRMLIIRMYEGRHYDSLKRGNLLEACRSVSREWQVVLENGVRWLQFSDEAWRDAMVLSQEAVGGKRWSVLAPDWKEK